MVEGEGKEGPLVNSMGPLQDTASSGDSSGLKQCTVMADQDLYAESSTGFSPASTENINISALTASGESGVATEKVSSLIYFDDSSVKIIFCKQQLMRIYENRMCQLTVRCMKLQLWKACS